MWIFLQVSGICIALLFNRLASAGGVGLPSFPSSLTPKDLKDFGTDLYFFGFCFFAPYFVVVNLSFRLIRYGFEYMDVPLFFARTAFYKNVLTSHFWPKWINISFRMIIKMSESSSGSLTIKIDVCIVSASDTGKCDCDPFLLHLVYLDLGRVIHLFLGHGERIS